MNNTLEFHQFYHWMIPLMPIHCWFCSSIRYWNENISSNWISTFENRVVDSTRRMYMIVGYATHWCNLESNTGWQMAAWMVVVVVNVFWGDHQTENKKLQNGAYWSFDVMITKLIRRNWHSLSLEYMGVRNERRWAATARDQFTREEYCGYTGRPRTTK